MKRTYEIHSDRDTDICVTTGPFDAVVQVKPGQPLTVTADHKVHVWEAINFYTNNANIDIVEVETK